MRKLSVEIGKYVCVLITCLQKTCKTFSWSRNWSQIQIPRPQLRASLGQTSCQELPGNFDQFDFVVWLCFCFCTLMFLAQSSLLAAWLSQALLQISITWSSVEFHILFQLRILTWNLCRIKYFGDSHLFSCPPPCLCIWPLGTGTLQPEEHPYLSFYSNISETRCSASSYVLLAVSCPNQTGW